MKNKNKPTLKVSQEFFNGIFDEIQEYEETAYYKGTLLTKIIISLEDYTDE